MEEDAVSFVRRRGDMFRVHSRKPGLGLVTALTRDALVYGNQACEVFQIGGWWFVVSEVDWLLFGKDDDQVEKAFHKIIATPEIEDNGMRSEILLTAFADAVWVITPDSYKMIKGDDTQKGQIAQLIDNRHLTKNWRRIVAFLASNHAAD